MLMLMCYSLPLCLVFRVYGHDFTLFVTAGPAFSYFRARLLPIRYRLTYFFMFTGTITSYSLPLDLFFHVYGHDFLLFVTAKRAFSFTRARFHTIRYRWTYFFISTGTITSYSLPLDLLFHIFGHDYFLFVTTGPIFSCLRARLHPIRYRQTGFFLSTGTITPYSLPLNLLLHIYGHDFLLFVTAGSIFSCLRARFHTIRYRSTYFFMFTGTITSYSLPLDLFFHVYGHDYTLFVTAVPIFSCLRARFPPIRYRWIYFFMFTGTITHYSLPLDLFFHIYGHDYFLFVTAVPIFSCLRARFPPIRYRWIYFFMFTGTITHYSLPLDLFFHIYGHDYTLFVTTGPIFSCLRARLHPIRYR